MINLSDFIQTAEVKDVVLLELSIHELTNLTPPMTDADYNALLEDMEVNGQMDPVLVYRGKIIDGRHRYKVMTQLNAEFIKVIHLPSNTTRNEIIGLIKTKETHRHQTPTQKAIYAFNMQKLHKEGAFGQASIRITQADAAKLYGASAALLARVSKLNKLRPDLLEVLFNGGKINTGTHEHKVITDSLLSILRWIELNKALEQEDITDIKVDEPPFSDKEYTYINQVINSVKKQSEVVRKELAKRLYRLDANGGAYDE